MLDLNLIRSNPEYVQEALKKREYDVDFTELLEWDARRRALLVENESLKAERNRMSKEIPALKKQGKDASDPVSYTHLDVYKRQVHEDDARARVGVHAVLVVGLGVQARPVEKGVVHPAGGLGKGIHIAYLLFASFPVQGAKHS